MNEELVNGLHFTIESKRYPTPNGLRWMWRTFYRVNGKLVARSEFIRQRKIARKRASMSASDLAYERLLQDVANS